MTGAADTKDMVGEDGSYIGPSLAKQQLAKIKNNGWQINYKPAGTADIVANAGAFASNVADYTTLDPARQPRQTWQDVHCKIEGPAVSELLRNFVLRWNTIAKQKLPAPKATAEYAAVGKARIQVLRSAPSLHCAKENKANNIKNSKEGKQQDIHVAMQQLIRNAARFIYIENQFFVSDFGEVAGVDKDLSPAAQYIKDGEKGVSDTTLWMMRRAAHGNADELDHLPQNKILETLLQRLEKAILLQPTPEPFHVYITLPVHPEGALFNASIAVQVFYTMQTIAFGSNSLLNGLKRILKARELKDKKEQDYARVFDKNNHEFNSIATEACDEYVTLLNLRNWDKLPDAGDKKGERYITEQIYVHSKLMIVDDRFAILGSANINDRSLLGERDSEIAVLVCDEEKVRADVYGDGSNQEVRKFAHELRVKVWNKLFGITGNVRPANHLAEAIKSPGNPASWKAIQKQAQQNAALYEAAFPFVPRSFVRDENNNDIPASILPTWFFDKKKETGYLKSPMPYKTSFWDKPQHTLSAVAGLNNIKGFITALPVEWAKGENIKIDFPTALIVLNDTKTKSDVENTKVSQSNINHNDETAGS
jgi:phospholipase D1/2